MDGPNRSTAKFFDTNNLIFRDLDVELKLYWD